MFPEPTQSTAGSTGDLPSSSKEDWESSSLVTSEMAAKPLSDTPVKKVHGVQNAWGNGRHLLFCCHVQSHGDSDSLALGKRNSPLLSVPRNFTPICGKEKKSLHVTVRKTYFCSVCFPVVCPAARHSLFKICSSFFFLVVSFSVMYVHLVSEES